MAIDLDFEKYLREGSERFRNQHTARRADEVELLLFILETQQNLTSTINQLRKVIDTMSTSIVTRDQFDQLLQDAVTTIKSKIDDLAAKVAAGSVTTPEDFSAELALVQSALGEAVTKDPDPTPAPPVTDPTTDPSTGDTTAS